MHWLKDPPHQDYGRTLISHPGGMREPHKGIRVLVLTLVAVMSCTHGGGSRGIWGVQVPRPGGDVHFAGTAALATYEEYLKKWNPKPIDRDSEWFADRSLDSATERRLCPGCSQSVIMARVAEGEAFRKSWSSPPISKYEAQRIRDYITLATSWIDTLAPGLGYKAGLALRAGFPIPCFDAGAVAEVSPPLLLLNTGFESQQGEYAKLAGMLLPIVEDTTAIPLAQAFVTDTAAIRRHIAAHQELRAMLRDLLADQISGAQDPARESFDFPRGSARTRLTMDIMVYMPRFVVAHEYGHVLLGHSGAVASLRLASAP